MRSPDEKWEAVPIAGDVERSLPTATRIVAGEENAKALFTKEPASMKLLVVVDKLLTGFDATPCTYLYIDKSMKDGHRQCHRDPARRVEGEQGCHSRNH